MSPRNLPPDSPQSRFGRWMTLGWVLILAKCALVPWAIQRWQVPIHPGWIVWPTLLFAGFATLIVVLRRTSPED